MSMYFDPIEWMSCIDNDRVPALININTGVKWTLVLDASTAKPVSIDMSVPYTIPIMMTEQDCRQVQVRCGMSAAVHSMNITGANSSVNALLRIFYDRFKIDVKWEIGEDGNRVADGYTVVHKPESEWQFK